MAYENDEFVALVDERYADIIYNGGVADDEDIFDYIITEDVINEDEI